MEGGRVIIKYSQRLVEKGRKTKESRGLGEGLKTHRG
jgi:hypothetical protein